MKQQTVLSSRQISTVAEFNEMKSKKGPDSFKISQASISYLKNPKFDKSGKAVSPTLSTDDLKYRTIRAVGGRKQADITSGFAKFYQTGQRIYERQNYISQNENKY